MARLVIDLDRLKKLRENLLISKSEMAKRISVSQPTYFRYESGERTPSIPVLKEIARVLNTSVDYLAGNDSDTSPDYYLVRKEDTPLLYELIDICTDMNTVQLSRLLAYADFISKDDLCK